MFNDESYRNAVLSRSERLGQASTPPTLIEAARAVEQWWVELDKEAHGFHGAPACMFDLRWALENEEQRKEGK